MRDLFPSLSFLSPRLPCYSTFGQSSVCAFSCAPLHCRTASLCTRACESVSRPLRRASPPPHGGHSSRQLAAMPRPPPPRRAPPAANVVKELSVGTYAVTQIKVRAGGASVTSQRLLQMRDSINDITIAVATAQDSLQAIKRNPAVRPPSPRAGASTGGSDVQSLAFASSTRAKLADEERKQDDHYGRMQEMAQVASEVQRARRDPVLQSYKQHVEVQLAAAAADGRLPPPPCKSGLTPTHQQMMLNPYSMASRPSRFAVSSGSYSAGSSATAPSPPSSTAPFRKSMPATVTSPYRTSTSSAAPSYVPSAAPAGATYGASPYPPAAGITPAPAYSPFPPTVYGGYGQAPPQQPRWNPPQAQNGQQRFNAL